MDRPFLTLPRLPVQFPLSTDSVLLADFAVLPRKHARVADLGAGIGTLGLLLCQKDPSCRVDGLELQPGAAALAPAVIRENGMEGRISVYPGDLRDAAAYLPRGGYDLVVSNPPYFPAGSGAQAASQELALARTELGCTLRDVCRAAAALLHTGGRFCLVHRPERLCDVISELRAVRLEPKRLRLVCHRPSVPPSLLLLESRLGGRPGLTILPELVLRGADGRETAEYRRIYGLGGT